MILFKTPCFLNLVNIHRFEWLEGRWVELSAIFRYSQLAHLCWTPKSSWLALQAPCQYSDLIKRAIMLPESTVRSTRLEQTPTSWPLILNGQVDLGSTPAIGSPDSSSHSCSPSSGHQAFQSPLMFVDWLFPTSHEVATLGCIAANTSPGTE